MPRSAEELLHAMASLQGQRALLGDAVADTALEALKSELAALALASQPSLEQQGQQPAQQLRLVSVLFLDIVGSTALSGKLHPEDVMAVIGGALAAFSAAIDQPARRRSRRAAAPDGTAWSAPGGDARSGPGRHPACAGAVGRWLARVAPEVATSDALKPCITSQSPSRAPTCGRLLQEAYLL